MRCFPFYHQQNFIIVENGWLAFQLEEEFLKLLHSSDSDWRISYVNKDFSVCRYSIMVKYKVAHLQQNFKNWLELKKMHKFWDILSIEIVVEVSIASRAVSAEKFSFFLFLPMNSHVGLSRNLLCHFGTF